MVLSPEVAKKINCSPSTAYIRLARLAEKDLVIKDDIISNSNRGGSVDTWGKIPVLKGVKVGKLSSQQYSDLHRKYLNRLYPEAKKTNIISANYTKDDNSLKIEWSFGKLVLNKEDAKLLLRGCLEIQINSTIG